MAFITENYEFLACSPLLLSVFRIEIFSISHFVFFTNTFLNRKNAMRKLELDRIRFFNHRVVGQR